MIETSVQNAVLDGGPALVDFGRDAYANLEIEVDLSAAGEAEIALGEVLRADGRLEREPGGYRTARVMRRCCPAGATRFRFELAPHHSPTSQPITVPLPAEADGEVVPFRYVEVCGVDGHARLRRRALFCDFDETAAAFECSDGRLNRIWELCKYTMKATGAFGIYIDGQRERKPYEGDAFVNQLGHFCCDRNYALARRTIEWFFEKPTYPTEWQLLMNPLARDYLLYSGDTTTVRQWLPHLRKRTFFAEASPDGLLRDECATQEARLLCRRRRDLVDWPVGELDGYDFGEVNLVPNCYYYGALNTYATLANAPEFTRHARRTREAILATMFQDGKFRDNPSSPHTALHSAFFPLYFGIADDAAQLKRLVAERGMACSVYAAHFLLETCFARGLVDEAFALLLSDGPRSWTNMLRRGATITMEAWDDCFKPNEDWNHAWGAAPANLIPRWIAGIRPLTPGFRRFAFDPHPGPLTAFSCRVPTPEATVSVEYDGHSFRLAVPEGTLAVTPRGELAPGVHSLAWPVASAAQPRR